MPDRPGTRDAGAVTDSVSAAVHGHGHRGGCGMDQPAYAFLRFASYESCYPSPFGDPRGRHPTSLIGKGFQSRLGAEGSRGRSEPITGALGGGIVPGVKIGGFTDLT